MANVDVEEILSQLKARGGRATTARRVIISTLLAHPEHVTAERLTELVQLTSPDINPATVYRTLEALEQLGVIYHVHLGHTASLWHLATDTHLHLVCEVCGQVTQVDAKRIKQMADGMARNLGFRPDFRHFALVGICSGCTLGA